MIAGVGAGAPLAVALARAASGALGISLAAALRAVAALLLAAPLAWLFARWSDPLRWPSPWLAVAFAAVAVGCAVAWQRGRPAGGEPPEPRAAAPSGWRAAAAYGLAPLAIYAAVFHPDIRGPLQPFHEGELLAPLDAVLRGGAPYRDAYLQHGLGNDVVVPWLGAQAFGVTVEGVRRAQQLVAPFGALALYALGLQLFHHRIVVSFAVALVAAGAGAAVSPRLAFGLLAVAALARACADARPHPRARARIWAAAGALSALAFWHSVDVGLYAIAAAAALLALRALDPGARRVAPLLQYAAGCAAVLAPVALWLLARGALADFAHNLWTQLRWHTAIWGLPFPTLQAWLDPLRDPGPLGLEAFASSPEFRAYLPIAALLAVAGYLAYRALLGGFWRSPGRAQLLVVWLFAAALWRSALGRADPQHVEYGSAPLWLIAGFAVDRAVSAARRSRSALRAAMAALAALAVAAGALDAHRPLRAIAARWTQPAPAAPAQQTLARVGALALPAAQVARVGAVVAEIGRRTAPQEPIFDFSNHGALYFLADRPAATRYHEIVYAATPAMQREVVDALERARVRLVVYRSEGWSAAIDGLSSAQRHPIVAAHLARHFAPAARVGGAEFWMRRGERPPDRDSAMGPQSPVRQVREHWRSGGL